MVLHRVHISVTNINIIQRMEKNITRRKLARVISPKETLMTLGVGESITISTRHIKTSTIRMAASRIEAKGIAKFEVTESGLINETKVTRIK